NKGYDGLYDRLRRLIEPPKSDEGKQEGLRYARYGLIDYVDAAMHSKSPYSDLARAGLRLSGLMRSLLFKRLESSVEAFRCTVSHLLESHRLFLTLLKEGKISAGEDVEPLLKDLEEGDAEDEDLLESLRTASGKYEIAHFDHNRLQQDIESDVEKLKKIKDTVVRRFAPIANNVPAGKVTEPIQILVATDVLSEGLNLQDAAYILNYDLHWNPVRLIQRFGRIDRLNTLHREIYAFNFLPDPKLDQHLGIEQTLRDRIAEIHESIGEDSPILEPDEQLNEKAMYAIYEGDGKALESFEEAEEE